MKALLLALVLACGPVAVCPSPCPNATGQVHGQEGLFCRCGDEWVGPFADVEAGPACDAQQHAWYELEPLGCPKSGGGTPP